MSLDLDILRQAPPESEQPGLDTTDPRLTDIASLVQDGNYAQAAAETQEVFNQGIIDIRLLGFFLYGLFCQNGPRGLAEICLATAEFLDANWEAIGPVKNREKHAQATFRWLFRQVEKKLDFEEKSQGKDWRQWLEETRREEVEQALAEMEPLLGTLRETLGDAAGPLADELHKLERHLSSFGQLLVQEEEESPPVEEGKEEEPDKEGESAGVASSQPPEKKPFALSAAAGDGPWVEGSVHLAELMRKLEAFELLMAQEKFQQAALVSDDILEAIEHFDPLRYFPRLFSRFFMLLATRSEEILGFEEFKESPQWRFLREYFKVDRDGFVDLEISGFGSHEPGEGGDDHGYYDDNM